MFIGHFAVGFASKKLSPKTNLGWLIAAPLFLDLIWPILLLLGLEKVQIEPGNTAFTPLNFSHYPISHSLLGALGWSVFLGSLYFVFNRYLRGAVVVGAGVLCHWIFDFIVHRPDLPLYPGGNMMAGLGLWNSIPGTLAAEFLLYLIGLYVYRKTTRPMDKAGKLAFGAFAIFIVILYIANIFSPPPENITILAGIGLIMWIFPFWAAFFDNHRTAVKTV